jgi:5-methylcytosine-specific restriction endonuclease McrA
METLGQLNRLPKKMRKYWRAQNGVCPYCGNTLTVSMEKLWRPTFDHVTPKRIAHGKEGNKVVAHENCNQRKGSRLPRPCELLFLFAINQRVFMGNFALLRRCGK